VVKKKMKYDIFISYRREGGYDVAKHLYDLLTRDGYKVSFDMDTLRNGDFDTQLLTRVEQCKDFILIVDEHAFDRTIDPTFDPNNDWLRQELIHALKYNKNIIPVFLPPITGFPPGLPDDVVKVTLKNGPKYDRYYFNDFYSKLKSTFLQTKKPRKIGLLTTLLIIFSILLGTVLMNINKDKPSIEDITKEISMADSLMQLNYIQQLLDKNEQYYDLIDFENLNVARNMFVSLMSKNVNAEQIAEFARKIDLIDSAFVSTRDYYISLSEWYLENYLDSMSYDCNQRVDFLNEYINKF
jgi:hypothetical protein